MKNARAVRHKGRNDSTKILAGQVTEMHECASGAPTSIGCPVSCWLPVQRAAAEGTLKQAPYKRLVMALFTWAALSTGISLMYRDLWNLRGLM